MHDDQEVRPGLFRDGELEGTAMIKCRSDDSRVMLYVTFEPSSDTKAKLDRDGLRLDMSTESAYWTYSHGHFGTAWDVLVAHNDKQLDAKIRVDKSAVTTQIKVMITDEWVTLSESFVGQQDS